MKARLEAIAELALDGLAAATNPIAGLHRTYSGWIQAGGLRSLIAIGGTAILLLLVVAAAIGFAPSASR